MWSPNLLLIILKSRVIAAATSVLGFTNKRRQLIKFPLPIDIDKQSRAQQLEYLKKAASLIVDKFVFSNDLSKLANILKLKGLVHGYAHVRAMTQLITYEQITNENRSSAVCECFAVNQLASCARRYL